MIHRIPYILGLVGLVLCLLPRVQGGTVNVGNSRLIVGTPTISDTFTTDGNISGRAPEVRPDGSAVTFRGSGAASGGIMTSGKLTVDYGLSKTYVIQFDGKQVSDRIDINFGNAGNAAGIGSGNTSFFVRASNSAKTYPGVGVYQGTPELGVAPVSSSLTPVDEWTNYAVVANTTLNQAKIFVNEKFIKSVNLREYGNGTKYAVNNGAVGFDASP